MMLFQSLLKPMTNYDMLIDTICSELYSYWKDGCNGEMWDDQLAKSTAHHILEEVEEFQSLRTKLQKPRWRASD